MNSTSARVPGRRDEKRLETLQRIREKGLQLFLANGYEATTLEDIAAAAGITKRTFFYYYKSKDEVLFAAQHEGILEALQAAIVAEPLEQSPFHLVRNCIAKFVFRYETPEAIVIDRIMQSTEALRVQKQARFIEIEEAIFAALCERWTQPERRTALRLVAMASVATMRAALENWRSNEGKRPLAECLQESFTAIETELSTGQYGPPTPNNGGEG